jgi:carotenoid cleavage dioxygenase-like enzyme
MCIHTGGAWEVEDGKVFLESSRVHDNAFPFFPPDDGRMPSPNTKADYVRWEFDLTKPTGSRLPDPQIVLGLPSEFPRIDERFLTKQHEWVFLNVFLPSKQNESKNLFHGLNALAMHSNRTGETRYFYAGDDSLVQEPIFIPRTDGAPEGDGWIMALTERRKESRCDLIFLDTREFSKPIAIAQLPFHIKVQVHGNWIDAKQLRGRKSLVRDVGEVKISGGGAFEPIF